jgi:hypothetical protein
MSKKINRKNTVLRKNNTFFSNYTSDGDYKSNIFLLFLILFSFVVIISGIFKNLPDTAFFFILLIIVYSAILIHLKDMPEKFYVIFGFLILAIVHTAGAFVIINGETLYHFSFIAGYFAYDNIVHLIGGYIATLFVYSFFKNNFIFEKSNLHRFYYLCLLVTLGVGIGAFIEILELFAVLFFDVGNIVGDYLNNAIDLVFDTIGAFISAVYVLYFRK